LPQEGHAAGASFARFSSSAWRDATNGWTAAVVNDDDDNDDDISNAERFFLLMVHTKEDFRDGTADQRWKTFTRTLIRAYSCEFEEAL